MMQSTDAQHLYHAALARPLYRPMLGWVFTQAKCVRVRL
jgi:hypothetical protein